jgi:hypothetical protein
VCTDVKVFIVCSDEYYLSSPSENKVFPKISEVKKDESAKFRILHTDEKLRDCQISGSQGDW